LGGQIESMRSQRRVPPIVNVRRFAPKRLGPRGVWGIVDRTRIIRAQIAGEAQQQVLLLAVRRGLPRLVDQFIPVGVGDLTGNHFLDLLPPMFHDFLLQVIFDLNVLGGGSCTATVVTVIY
jgi:hypothetical protein